MRNDEIKLCAGVLDAVIIKNLHAYNHAVTLCFVSLQFDDFTAARFSSFAYVEIIHGYIPFGLWYRL